MGGAIYIGDETHAAAWRLTGIDVRIAAAGSDIGRLFSTACRQADLVLVSPSCAARIPAALLDQARRALTPLLLVLPAIASADAGPELVQRVRSQLGMET